MSQSRVARIVDGTEPVIVRIERALLVAGFFVFLFCLPHGNGPDGTHRFGIARRLVEKGEAGTHWYSAIQPAFATPLYVVGRALGDPMLAVAMFNFIVFFAGLFVLHRLSRGVVPPAVARRAALILLGASLFAHFIGLFCGEIFTTFLTVTAVALVVRGRARGTAALFGLAAANTPAAALGLLALSWERARQARRLAVAVPPLAAAAAIILVERFLRRGLTFASGYEGNAGPTTVLPFSGEPGFSYPFVLGLMGQLFSFGHGLFWFVPAVVLCFVRAGAPMPEPLQRAQRMLIAFTVGLVLVYSKWWCWWGWTFFGPRFLQIACVPAAVALAHHLGNPGQGSARRLLVVVVTALSLWVGFTGGVVRWAGASWCRTNELIEPLCIFSLEGSPLVTPFYEPTYIGNNPFMQVATLWFVLVGAVLLTPAVLAASETVVADLKAEVRRFRGRDDLA